MRKERTKLPDLLPLVVFALFALCLMGVLLSGAGVYQRLNEDARKHTARRTAAQYLSTRIRQGDRVTVGEFGGCPALEFPEVIQGEDYVTRVYCYEGSLRELYSPASARLQPEDGEILLPLTSLTAVREGSLLTVTADDQILFFSLNRERQVDP